MEKGRKLLLSMIFLVVLVMGLYFFTGWFSKTTGFVVGENTSEEIQFAKCLKGKGVVLFGTEKCRNCAYIEELFGDGFGFLNYVNCNGTRECKDLTSLPAWKIKEEIYYKIGSFEELRTLSGCN